MIRVFPRRTKWTPDDELAFVGDPPLFRPPDQSVRISVTFTWDLFRAKMLHQGWSDYYSDVKVGGPACGDPGEEFEPGRFIKKGIAITSRGCPRKCSWCFVPKREGSLREIEIKDGWDVVDNNLLACSKDHIKRVFEMLARQSKAAIFSGGLDARLFNDWHLNLIEGIRIRYLWFACDNAHGEKPLRRVADMIRHIPYHKKRCYVLIGVPGDIIPVAEARLKRVFDLGFLPMAMLYQDEVKRNTDKGWRKLQKHWSRPAIYKHEDGKK